MGAAERGYRRPELPSVAARAVSSAGRAPALHAGGRRFESCTAHLQARRHAESAWRRRPTVRRYATSSPSGRWKFRPTDPAELIAEGAPQRDGRDLSQVRVRSVEPVLTRWAEDVHVDRLLERLGLVWHAGGNVEHLAGADVDHLGLVLTEPEAQRPLEDAGDLLVLVVVQRHDAALVEIEMRDHQPLGADEPPVQARLHLRLRYVFPAVERCPDLVHALSPLEPDCPLERAPVAASVEPIGSAIALSGRSSCASSPSV